MLTLERATELTMADLAAELAELRQLLDFVLVNPPRSLRAESLRNLGLAQSAVRRLERQAGRQATRES